MKGKELYEQAIRKATRWNHGRTPDTGIQLIFIYNELKDKIVLNKADESFRSLENIRYIAGVAKSGRRRLA